MDTILRCTGLTKRFGSLAALNDVNLTLERGRIIGLLGPNGSGKTTLIKLINGLLTPTSGTIEVCGKPVGPETKAHVSYLPDRTYLTMSDRVTDVLDYFCDFYDDFDRSRAEAMLDSLGINPQTRLKTMSKGTKEKVQLILVMSRQADLYVLDEPIAGVDPAARDYIIRTIINNYNPQASLLISTHLISDIENILDDVVMIKLGQILFHASADEIREKDHVSIDALFREVFKC